MPELSITNLLSEWPQTVRTKLPIQGLTVKTDPKEGTTSLEFGSPEFTRTLAAKVVLKGDNFSRQYYANDYYAMNSQNALLEYVAYLGDSKYELMVVGNGRFIPIRFEADTVALFWDTPSTSCGDITRVLEYYRHGGWGDVWANVLPYWPENHYTRPHITHPDWKWVFAPTTDKQHPYPHVDREMLLIRVSSDIDDDSHVDYEITRADYEDAVKQLNIRRRITESGMPRFRVIDGDYGSVEWLGRYGVFDLHCCDDTVVAGTVDDTGTTIFETAQLGTRNPFAPDWYWEALTRLGSQVPRDVRDYYFNLRGW